MKVTFKNGTVKEVAIEADAVLSGANLRDADLSGANLSGADLRDAVLSGANLSGADLRDADLSGANLSGANLRDADLSGANLRDAVLSGANLSGADLRDAVLRDAVLRDADLSGADLRDADLRDADLSGANLSGADLRGANLSIHLPIIEQIDRKILQAINNGGKLDMTTWHACQTTHCRAGWATFLSGESGKVLESILGTNAAAALIYTASRPDKKVPDFFASNRDTMADLVDSAKE
jgi:Pentapeptide repeats (8 copies)